MKNLTYEDQEWLVRTMVYLLQGVNPEQSRLVEQQGDRQLQEIQRNRHIEEVQRKRIERYLEDFEKRHGKGMK